MATQTLSNFFQALIYIVVAMLEDNLCPPAHFDTQGNLQTSEAYTSKTFDLNDIKFGALNQSILGETYGGVGGDLG